MPNEHSGSPIEWDADVHRNIYRPEIIPTTESMKLFSKKDYQHMGTLNILTTTCLSLGTGFLFQTLQFLWLGFDRSNMIPAEWAFLILSAFVTLVFYIGGWWIYGKQSDVWESASSTVTESP